LSVVLVEAISCDVGQWRGHWGACATWTNNSWGQIWCASIIV